MGAVSISQVAQVSVNVTAHPAASLAGATIHRILRIPCISTQAVPSREGKQWRPLVPAAYRRSPLGQRSRWARDSALLFLWVPAQSLS